MGQHWPLWGFSSCKAFNYIYYSNLIQSIGHICIFLTRLVHTVGINFTNGRCPGKACSNSCWRNVQLMLSRLYWGWFSFQYSRQLQCRTNSSTLTNQLQIDKKVELVHCRISQGYVNWKNARREMPVAVIKPPAPQMWTNFGRKGRSRSITTSPPPIGNHLPTGTGSSPYFVVSDQLQADFDVWTSNGETVHLLG